MYISQDFNMLIKSGTVRFVSTDGKEEKRTQYFAWKKTEGKRKLGRPRRRWKGDIRLINWDKIERVWTECIWLGISTFGRPL